MSLFLERLRKYQEKDDRGMMANLRCILVSSKKHRAWPALNRLGLRVDQSVEAFVAGLYATHPQEGELKNFGSTCRLIMRKRDDSGPSERLIPLERRFQHLLAAEKGEELHARVLRFVFLAKAEGIPINYDKLESDLRYWGDRTKTEWAGSFWDVGEVAMIEDSL